MGRILITLLLLACAYGGYKHLIEAKTPSVLPSSVAAKPEAKPGQRNVNGVIMLSRAEIDIISQQVKGKFERLDFTPIYLSDGTQIPLKFVPKGRICSRTGLPECTVSLDARLGIVN